MRVAVLPMDNRPPNYQFLKRLADMLDIDLVLPEKESLGYYMTAAPVKELGEWILAQQADIYLVSLEMLVFGGLIASREEGASLEECENRVATVGKLKQSHPASKVFLSSIVRRASISTFSVQSARTWQVVNDYFKALADKRIVLASEIERQLPLGYLKQYMKLRNRNHLVNKMAIDLVHNNAADLLVLAQEDTFHGGPQTPELQLLMESSGEFLNKRIFIHNGADEVCQELLARAASDDLLKELCVVYDDALTADRVMDFEDRPFRRNVDSHVNLCKFTQNLAAKKTLVVSGTSISRTLEIVDRELDARRKVGLLDVFKANGSQRELFESLGVERIARLFAFSAWNTASNSLGTALSVLAMNDDHHLKNKTRLRFLIERMIDDYLYQGVLREVFEEELSAVGGNHFKVSETPEVFAEFKDRFMEEANRRILSPINSLRLIPFTAQIKTFELPWDRTFECEISVELAEISVE